jgi:hypothetical protein
MPTPKPKAPTGAAAVRELQRQVSPAGVAAAEAKARKAVEKKNGFVSNNGSSITKFTQKLKSLGK